MISITTENIEQFYAALEEETAELVYADAGSAEPAEYRHYAETAHKAGKYCGFRLPHIWREEAEAFVAARAQPTAERLGGGSQMELREAYDFSGRPLD